MDAPTDGPTPYRGARKHFKKTPAISNVRKSVYSEGKYKNTQFSARGKLL
jgi:hypothetical protein